MHLLRISKLLLATLLTQVNSSILERSSTSTGGPDSLTSNFSAISVDKIIEVEVDAHLENLAVRATGDILVTRVDKPYLYLVEPSNNTYFVIKEFDNKTSTLGIAEYLPDVFAVCVGSADAANYKGIPGTWEVVSVNLTGGLDAKNQVNSTTIASVPEAALLNGAAFRAPSTYYAADSQLGLIWGIDLDTKEVEVAVPNHELLNKTATQLGVNGLRWVDSEQALYFTNSALGIIGTVPLDANGTFGEPRELAASLTNVSISSWDDIAVKSTGEIFASTGNGNTINYISADGQEQYIVVGSKESLTVPGPTSAQFGRLPEDQDVLYVTFMGSSNELIDGKKAGGGVLAVSLTAHQ